jgi:hypothetical protein
MKASEILDKFKKVLLSEDGEVTIAETPQEVELAEQAQPEASS